MAPFLLLFSSAHLLHRFAAMQMAFLDKMGDVGLVALTIATAATLLFSLAQKKSAGGRRNLLRFAMKFVASTGTIVGIFVAWSIFVNFWIYLLVLIPFLAVQFVTMVNALLWLYLKEHRHRNMGLAWLCLAFAASLGANVVLYPIFADDQVEFWSSYARYSRNIEHCNSIDEATILTSRRLVQLSGCAEIHRFDDEGNPLPLYRNVTPKKLGDSYYNDRGEGLLIWKELGFSVEDPFFASCKMILRSFAEKERTTCKMEIGT